MKNALSFDMEDWYQVHNYEHIIKYSDWNKQESRIEQNTHKILNILDEKKTKATFFCLGWIAEKNSKLIKEISKKGHEIATHGYRHRLIYNLTPKEYEQDLRKSIQILQKITGKKIIGHRAPSFSIVEKNQWAFDVMKKAGIKYDSSIYPIKHPDYGMSDSPINIHSRKGILELPLSTIRIFGKNIPVAGGGYFRAIPYFLTRLAIQKINKTRPAIVYIHPWELDPKQPKLNVGWLRQIRQFIGIKRTEKRLKKLLREFQFTTISEVLKEQKML